jgi:hypothetical protein
VDINAAVSAIETWLADYVGPDGRKALALQVRPSGDDVDVIKIWVDLGDTHGGGDAADAWESACEKAIRSAIPAAGVFRLQVRAE